MILLIYFWMFFCPIIFLIFLNQSLRLLNTSIKYRIIILLLIAPIVISLYFYYPEGNHPDYRTLKQTILFFLIVISGILNFILSQSKKR